MRETPLYLGVIHHPAIGIRIPEVLLNGILWAFREARVAGTLMLSYGRETAPEYVINAPPGRYEITKGHTGTSIRRYLTLAGDAARRLNVPVELEADHVTLSTSSVRAVKRISGVKEEAEASEEELEEALRYIRDEVEEAVSTGYIRFYTIDTCDLIRYSADSMDEEDVEAAFEEIDGHEKILERYVGRRFVAVGESGRQYVYKMGEREVKRLAVKYWRSLEGVERVYGIIREKTPWEFGVEIAFDETPHITRPPEMLFFMNELWERGIPVDYIAPNIGFEKKQDYRGSLSELYRRVDEAAAVALRYGALLSFHSGSGSSPWSGKGPGVYEALLSATGGRLKYKVSGVYYELLLEILSSEPPGSRARRLYEEIYDAVIDYVEREVERKGPLYSEVLEKQLEEYKRVTKDLGYKYPAWASVFRYYSFIALNLREDGRRRFRDEIVSLYQEDEALRHRIDREVAALTLRLIDGLEFRDNVDLLEQQR